MVDLENYKNYLVNVYRYPIDNTDEKRIERMKHLNKIYGDDYLNKIIYDSYSFIRNIFDNKDPDCDYYSLDLDDDTTCFISLNLTGGYSSDRLYIDPDGNIISQYILNNVFGNRLCIYIKEDEFVFDTDDDIVSFNYKYSLYLQTFPKNMNELKEQLFDKEKVLIKVNVD